MSLPPGFLDELRSRTSLAQVVGRKVVWDTRKSNQGKGDMWAPCPFHQEKTASFHVDDRKGFYYCFGCHAKGDAIGFVKETENVGFMEAVEILARETGMTMPARDPKAKEKADRRTQLADVMEQAVQWYRLQLKTGTATQARDYLAGRGLSEAAQERWEIGFAPDDRQGVFRYLTGKGVAPDLILDAGLSAQPDNGGAPYDRFRGRIIFPIRDARGRAIALGGRAMDPNARAKYLNSPETELFDKGRSLFNHGPAREASGKGDPLVVAEGYMDVIALSEAGIKATVAPLGTAVTEDQLGLLWRISDEPIIALDGDKAGLRAAMRVVDLALPLIEAGKSLRFCLMPDGMDPDDLIKAEGPGAMRKLLDGAMPMVSLLWQRETEGKVFDSPERKAALDRQLRFAISKVKDPSLKRHYSDEINRLRRKLFDGDAPTRSNWGARRRFGQARAPSGPTVEAKSSALAAAGERFEDQLREAVILATLIRHPDLILRFETELERMDAATSDHATIRDALLQVGARDYSNFDGMIEADTLEKLFALRHVQISPGLRAKDGRDIAEMTVAEEFAKLQARRGAAREIEEAVEDVEGVVDEGLTWRLSQASEAVTKAGRGDQEDKTEYETGPNGARMKREERQSLDALIDQIKFSKGS